MLRARLSWARILPLFAVLLWGAAGSLVGGPRVIDIVADTDNRFKIPRQKEAVITLKARVAAGRLFRASLPTRSLAPTNQKWVMVVDLAKCDGCRDCTRACRKMHYVPPFQEWIKVYEVRDNPAAGPYFLARPCMHCDNPPCVRACPVGATFKRTDGIVMQDLERCIGCRNCIAQCPYSARFFNWGEPPHAAEELAHVYSTEYNYPHPKGVVEKCIFCPHLLREGKLPACASACTMGAIYFGDEYEDAVTNSKGETLQLSKIATKGAAFRLMEELGTEPRVYYLPPASRKYPSPNEKRLLGTAGEPMRS